MSSRLSTPFLSYFQGHYNKYFTRWQPSASGFLTARKEASNANALLAFWRSGWDSNPRTGSSPIKRFRVVLVMTTSIPLQNVSQHQAHKNMENWWENKQIMKLMFLNSRARSYRRLYIIPETFLKDKSFFLPTEKFYLTRLRNNRMWQSRNLKRWIKKFSNFIWF